MFDTEISLELIGTILVLLTQHLLVCCKNSPTCVSTSKVIIERAIALLATNSSAISTAAETFKLSSPTSGFLNCVNGTIHGAFVYFRTP